MRIRVCLPKRGCGYARQYESGPDGRQKLVIHTDQVLSFFSGNIIVKATLGERPCAAKIFYPDHERQAWQIWRDLKHPNIVQFLGKVQDPRNNRPIILMELMEQNLGGFLLRSSTGVPYHVQVNISHDIALAVQITCTGMESSTET